MRSSRLFRGPLVLYSPVPQCREQERSHDWIGSGEDHILARMGILLANIYWIGAAALCLYVFVCQCMLCSRGLIQFRAVTDILIGVLPQPLPSGENWTLRRIRRRRRSEHM